MLLQGKCVGTKPGEGFYIFCPVDATQYGQIVSTHSADVTVEFDDRRGITSKQRRKAYVLIKHIADWWGYTPVECMKELTKLDFAATGCKLGDGLFSLATTDRTTARKYISFLIDFCLVHDVPCGEPLWKLCEDVGRYVYSCLVNHRCAVCGRKAELHHYDAVGMGRSRKEICHVGMKVLPLCREHHAAIHSVGRDEFCKMYILEPVKVDAVIAEKYKLKR